MELFWIGLASISALGAMLLTGAMAIFAWRAWNTAQEQLEHARKSAVREQQYPALLEMLSSLDHLLEWCRDDDDTLDDRITEMMHRSDLWMLSYGTIYECRLFPKVVNELNLVLRNNRSLKPIISDSSLPILIFNVCLPLLVIMAFSGIIMLSPLFSTNR